MRPPVFLLCFCLWSQIVLVCSAPMKADSEDVVCSDLPEAVLADILGPAFNSRYMSIHEPSYEEWPDHPGGSGGGFKRTVANVPPFYVEEDYTHDISEEPAWIVRHAHVELHEASGGRRRRKAPKQGMQWECESKIGWIDLGPDHFPRYLRSVECKTKYCWYGHYQCKPRSFAVKILRRRNDRCTVATPGSKIGTAGLPADLKVLWVWEERAVNFCCDCAT